MTELASRMISVRVIEISRVTVLTPGSEEERVKETVGN